MEVKVRLDLPALMKELGLPMIAVEVGVCGGHNSTDFLKWGIEKIYCVDAWETQGLSGDGAYPQKWHDKNYQSTYKLLSQFSNERYTILKGLSSQMHEFIPDNSLGLVYLDGGHDYGTVKSDLENYYPKLVAGGIMAGHDYLNESYGIKRAVEEFAGARGLTIHQIPESNPTDSGFWFRI